MRRGIRFPQWWMLLVAILAILSGQGSLVGMERFAKRHRQMLNELLGTDFGKSPSDSTFRLLLAQLNVPGFESLLRGWMTAQSGVAEQMQVIPRHIDRARVAGRPEAHQDALHVLQIERRLGIGGTHQIHAGLGLAGHPIADPLKHPTQTNRHKKVGVVAQRSSRAVRSAQLVTARSISR